MEPVMVQPAPTGGPQIAFIERQAGSVGWMAAPPLVGLNCAPGLECLSVLDQIIVHQKKELLEIISGYETQNKYNITNISGQDIYFAKEESSCCNRHCCGPSREFNVKFYDSQGREVMNLHRPLKCQCCLCFCCLQELEVSAPPGTVIGSVRQDFSLCLPRLRILDAQGQTVLLIHGPCHQCSCCSDVVFKVLSSDGSQLVGEIHKKWAGYVREMVTDADNFNLTIHIQLDINTKAVLLGAVFLIDYMYYERPANRRH